MNDFGLGSGEHFLYEGETLSIAGTFLFLRTSSLFFCEPHSFDAAEMKTDENNEFLMHNCPTRLCSYSVPDDI